MASQKVTALTNYAGGQGPSDLTYIAKSPFGSTDDRKSTLADLFNYYNKNTTDGSFQMQGIAAPSVSAASVGKIYFDSTSNTFRVSQNGGAFFDLGNISGSLTSGRVPYASGANTLTDNAGLTFTPNALTIGTAATPGGLRLVGNTGNYWNLASSAPAGNRTFYFPDSTTPTTGNFLFVGTFGATVVTDWSTGLTWSNSSKQITVTSSTNAQIGLGVQNTNAGTAAECVVGFTANGGAISLLSLTGTGFSTSGLYKANQLYWRGTTGITEMLFALDDASTAFKFGVNNAVAASINATSTEGLVLGIASSLTGRVKLFNSAGATYTQISAGNAASSLNYILPATAPTAGQVLTASAPSGVNVTLSWGSAAGGSLAVNNVSGTPTFAGVTTLLIDDVNGGISAVNSGGNPSLGVVAGNGISVASTVAVNQAFTFAWTAAHTLSVNATQSATTAGTTYQPSTTPSSGQYRWSPAVVLNGAANSGSGAVATGFRLYSKGSDANGTAALTFEQRNLQISPTWFQVANLNQTAQLALGVASTLTGGLTLYNSAGANATTLQAGNAASALTFVWPTVDPTAGQVLSASAPSGGTVTMSWVSATGGTPGGSGSELQYRAGASSFGGMTGTVISGAALTLGNTSDGRYLLTQPGSVNSVGNWGSAQRVTVTNAGDATHPNEIYTYGFNYLGQGVAVDNRAPAWGWSLESHWAPNAGQPNVWQMEHYIDYIAPTDLSVFPGSNAVPTFRPFGLTIAPVAGTAVWDWRGNTFDWITAFTGAATKLHADASNLQFTGTSPVFQLIDQATSSTLDIRYNGSNQFSAIFPSWYFLSSSTLLPALQIENAHTNLNPTIESRVYGTAAPQTNTGSVGLHVTNKSGSANVYSSIGFSGFYGVPAVFLAAQTITEAPYYSEAVLYVNTRSGQTYEALRTSFENTGSISVVTFAGQGNNNPRLDLLNPGFGSTGGMYLDGANTALQFHLNSNRVMQVRYTGVTIFGPADAASPTAQTLSVQSVVAGTSNTAGADWTFKASAGTGTGAGGNFLWQTAAAGGSGSSQNTFSTKLTLTSDGRLYGSALHDNSGSVTGTVNQYIASGSYTPTLTAVANCTVNSATVGYWIRVGNVVTVTVQLNIDPTLTATTTQARVSLPIASNFAGGNQCGGTIYCPGIAGLGAAILADVANDEALIQFVSTDVTDQLWSGSFTYVIA